MLSASQFHHQIIRSQTLNRSLARSLQHKPRTPTMSKVEQEKKVRKPAGHPKYTDMIKAALASLKERNGASRQAIEKYIKTNYKVGDNCGSHLKLALKRMSERGTLVHTKGVGASGSFKLNKAVKEEKPKKKPVAKKPAKKPVAKKDRKSKSPKKAKASEKTKKPGGEKPKKAAKKPAAKNPAKKTAKKPAAKKAPKSPKK